MRHAQIFGLATRHCAIKPRVPEQRRSLTLLTDLGRFALRLEAGQAHEACPTRNAKGNNNPVANPQATGINADLLDNPHGLVAEDVSRSQVGTEHRIEMEVGAANGRRRHANDRVGRFKDLRIRHRLDAKVLAALPCECTHVLYIPDRPQPEHSREQMTASDPCGMHTR